MSSCRGQLGFTLLEGFMACEGEHTMKRPLSGPGSELNDGAAPALTISAMSAIVVAGTSLGALCWGMS